MKQPEQLGPYKIIGLLGRGGMGSVYEGIDEAKKLRVAIKVLMPQMAVEAGFRERFESEIETLKVLSHPNIVELFAYGEQGGSLFYAMELVDGTNLEDELQAGRQYDWREVTEFAIQICKALKHAHDHGVIHRDIKPANLLVTKDNQVKLTDFGIARLFGNVGMTADGGILGTAEYMAPEQADGRPVTPHCDLYSLGGVMYALLSGRPPFRSTSLPELLHMQRYSEPDPVRRHAVDTPAELEQVIDRLLAKDPRDRYANATVVARHLEAMRNALSLRDEDADKEFQVATPGEASDPTLSNDPNAATMAPRDLPAPKTAAPSGETSLYTDPGEAPKPGAATEPTSTTDRFMRVEEETVSDESGENVWTSPQTWILSLALILLVLGAWYLKPRSSSELFDHITTVASAAENDASRSVREVEADIYEFLRRFPNDERAVEVRRIKARLNPPVVQGDDPQPTPTTPTPRPKTSPIEFAYREAMAKVNEDPDAAAARLKALIVLYGDAAPSEFEKNVIRRAQDSLRTLEEATKQRRAATLKLVQQRIVEAKAAETEQPLKARAIYEAIVELYGNKPWAASVVRGARERLESTMHTSTAETGDSTPGGG